MQGPSASEIDVRETLELLDSSFSYLAEGVAGGRFALWLGAGISLRRADGLKHLTVRVLEFLRSKVDTEDPECVYRVALFDALGLAAGSWDSVHADLSVPVANWRDVDHLAKCLEGQYSRLLDITVVGEEPDYLLWDALNFPETFGANKDPDGEHLSLAVLGLEDAAPDMLSGNWDGLIEAATRQLQPTLNKVMKVVVRDVDYQLADRPIRLVKFHGCAVCAAADPDTYRPLLIARRTQITKWGKSEPTKKTRLELERIAGEKPTLMLGLSAQDENLRAIFVGQDKELSWPWNPARPAHVFSDDRLGRDHRDILKMVYGETVFAAEGQVIEGASLLRAYAKQLLCALALYVIAAKLREGLGRLPKAPAKAVADGITRGLVHMRDLVADLAPGGQPEQITSLIDFFGAFELLARDGTPRKGPNSEYRPLVPMPLERIGISSELPRNGVPELAVALGVLGLGDAEGAWSLGALPPSVADIPGALLVTNAARTTTVLLAASHQASIEMQKIGLIRDGAADIVLLESKGSPVQQTRGPRSRLGRDGTLGTRRVAIEPIVVDASSLEEALQRFKEAATL